MAAPTAQPGSAGVEPAGGAPAVPVRYRILQEIGRGGMGVVYRAHDGTLGRDVALKVLLLGGRVDAEALGRFGREARAAAALDHPGIVRVHDVGALPDGRPYYTMELLAGRDLAGAIFEHGIAPRDAIEAVRQVALALAFAHGRGILHRDIKPQNIFLRQDPAGEPRADAPTIPSGTGVPSSEVHALLLDFGLAKLSEGDLAAHAEGSEGRRSLQSLTRSGEVFGTPAYMPPEQARDAKAVDARADVYSLGASLYHALAGRPPFDAPSLADLLEKVQKVDPPPPSAWNAEVDADLDTVCLKCLAKEAKDRYQDAAALAEDCRRWLAGEPITARPVGVIGRLWRKAKRNRAASAAIALGCVAALAVASAWAGTAISRRVEASRRLAHGRAVMAEGRWDAAMTDALDARALAPKDPAIEALLAAICRERGLAGKRRYEAERDGEALLLARIDAAADAKPPATPDDVDEQSAAHRSMEEALRSARIARAEAWSSAVRDLQEALRHDASSAAARDGLLGLYFDEYMRAVRAGDEAEEARYRRLMLDAGGERAAAILRGEGDVRVAFRLPASFRDDAVAAWLLRYERNADPPLLAPTPCDPRTGAALSPPLIGEWRRIPLKDAQAPDAPAALAARSGTAYPLRATDANRVAIPVSDGFARFALRLPVGSYLLWIPRESGLCEARYPFEVAYDFAWDEACDLAADDPPDPPGFPPGSGPCWAFVPAVPCRVGGDPRAALITRRRAARVPAPEDRRGLFVGRFPVTIGMYEEYLDDAKWFAGADPDSRAPRDMYAVKQSDRSLVARDAAGRWRPKPCFLGAVEMWPVMGVSYNDAVDYAKWLTATHGGGRWTFDLPTEDEWERAARGVDGRFLPWGRDPDPSLCRLLVSRPGEQAAVWPEQIGLFPADEGPFGIRDMAGGMCSLTSTPSEFQNGSRIVKGGSWAMVVEGSRCAGRGSAIDTEPNIGLGIRLCARPRR